MTALQMNTIMTHCFVTDSYLKHLLIGVVGGFVTSVFIVFLRAWCYKKVCCVGKGPGYTNTTFYFHVLKLYYTSVCSRVAKYVCVQGTPTKSGAFRTIKFCIYVERLRLKSESDSFFSLSLLEARESSRNFYFI